MEVQKDQTRIFKIEEQKYLREIRPNVYLNISTNVLDDNNDVTNHLLVTINLTSRKAKNINHIVKSSDYSTNRLEGYGEIKGEKLYLKNISQVKSKPEFPQLLIEMKYTDCDGNKYVYKKEILFKYGNCTIDRITLHESENIVEPVY